MYQAVIPADTISSLVEKLSLTYQTTTVILGNGTAHQWVQKLLIDGAPRGKPLTFFLVDEKYSTEEARSRYWQCHPPSGLRRLIPVTMQTPPVPVDDYVAVILAERYFKETHTEKI